MVVANLYIGRALALAEKLKALADDGTAAVEDDGCAVLFGLVRDCAYKIEREALRQRRSEDLSAPSEPVKGV